MNWDRANGNWKQLKGRLRCHWARLTENRVAEVAGSREVLVGKLQEAYGIGKEQADLLIEDWRTSVREVADDIDASPRQMNARR